jgi:hypothetical protein
MTNRRQLCFAAVVALAAIPAFAGEAEEGPEVFDEIEVRVINLEVRFTDKKGHHVADLRPADFRLEIDGEPVPIDYFSEIRDRHASRCSRRVERALQAATSTLRSFPAPSGRRVMLLACGGWPRDSSSPPSARWRPRRP